MVEDGFVYSTFSGALFANGVLPSLRNMEGDGAGGGGVLSIVAEDGGLFSFVLLEYAAFDESREDGEQTLTILGLRQGVVAGTVLASAFNSDRGPSFGARHVTVGAADLVGLPLDELRIVLDGGENPQLYFQAVDDIHLQARAVPEPSTWALMIGGFGLAGGALRRRRMALAA